MVLKELHAKKKHHSKGVSITRKVVMYFFIALGLFILLIPSLLIATYITQYYPVDGLRIVVNDTRTDKDSYKELEYGKSYSALDYNVGFDSYNQEMHYFMDGDGQYFLHGQGRAKSYSDVIASMQGVDRVLSGNHDTSIQVPSNDWTHTTAELRGSKIYTSTYDTNGIWESDGTMTLDGLNQLLNNNTFDFISIQEQDRDATRSRYTDQYKLLNEMRTSTTDTDTDPYSNNENPKISDIYDSTYAYNYAVPWVPMPLTDMSGQSLAGITTMSKYKILDDDENYPRRMTLSSIQEFPLSLFELKRCFTINRFQVEEGGGLTKQFVFITCHFSAYDSTGEVRRAQLKEVNDLFSSEVAKGNYVMLAADWNQTMPQTYGYEGDETNDDDPAIAPWDYQEFIYNSHNCCNPDEWKDFKKYDDYDATKRYKKDQVIWYQNANDPTVQPLSDMQIYMQNRDKHLYKCIVDQTKLPQSEVEPPLISDGSGGLKKSHQWMYLLDRDYEGSSLTKNVLANLLPITTDTSDSGAKLWTIHAMPTCRNAGEDYRNEAAAYEDWKESGETTDFTGGHMFKCTIDGFLVSNNINVQTVFGLDTNFKYSDHQPFGLIFSLKQEV